MARPESHMCVLVILNAKMVFNALKNIVKVPPPSSRGLINFTPQERWAYRNREGLIPTAIKYLSCSQLSTLNSSV